MHVDTESGVDDFDLHIRVIYMFSLFALQSSTVSPVAAMTSTSGSSKAEFHVGGKYRLVRKIGSGSFGDIYLGKYRPAGKSAVAFSVTFN